jgi:serine/threonine-protein kinase HipA
MIRVWADGQATGVLDRFESRGSTFFYDRPVDPSLAISLTMPPRSASWNTSIGLAPIFEMNLPEGALRERLRATFAKATGSFDDIDLLSLVGRSQIGRIRCTGLADQLDEAVPFQSVDEILAGRRSDDLYRYLIERFASSSGISGVQPKVLIRDQAVFTGGGGQKSDFSETFRGATHIVKFYDSSEYPHLATNEYFCLKAAEAAGLTVPPYQLAENGGALIMERFDLRPDGSYRGFEDFCVLNGRGTAQKYSGSYETRVLRRFQQFASSSGVAEESVQVFRLIVFNCAIRNGDAHLKNFGMLYDRVQGTAHLAPAYDLVTTTAYIPKDRMALTLNGSTEWPGGGDLARFAEGRSLASPRQIKAIFEQTCDALSEVAHRIEASMKSAPHFRSVGGRMLSEWQSGIAAIRSKAIANKKRPPPTNANPISGG